MNPVPGSTLVIHAHDVEDLLDLLLKNKKPTPIGFNIYEKLGGGTYRLTGMVLARKVLYELHYTTIAYVSEKNSWYNFNDRKVRPVDPPRWNNLAGDPRNVPLMFFYTLENKGGFRKKEEP